MLEGCTCLDKLLSLHKRFNDRNPDLSPLPVISSRLAFFFHFHVFPSWLLIYYSHHLTRVCTVSYFTAWTPSKYFISLFLVYFHWFSDLQFVKIFSHYPFRPLSSLSPSATTATHYLDTWHGEALSWNPLGFINLFLLSIYSTSIPPLKYTVLPVPSFSFTSILFHFITSFDAPPVPTLPRPHIVLCNFHVRKLYKGDKSSFQNWHQQFQQKKKEMARVSWQRDLVKWEKQ